MNEINGYLLAKAKRIVADARGRKGRDWLTYDENVVSLVVEGMLLALDSLPQKKPLSCCVFIKGDAVHVRSCDEGRANCRIQVAFDEWLMAQPPPPISENDTEGEAPNDASLD